MVEGSKIIQLETWEEITGTLENVIISNDYIKVQINNLGKTRKLNFSDTSTEYKILKKQLKDVKIGTEIGILRTNLHEKPIIVRTVVRGEIS